MENTKSELNLKNLIVSGKILASSLNKSKDLVVDGAIPEQIDKKIEKFIHSLNAVPSFKGYNGYPSSTCISLNHQIVHGIPKKVPLKEGDIVTVDIGVSYKKNHTDAARTFIVGNNPNKKQEKLLQCCNKALNDGISKAINNNNVGDISYAIQRIIEFSGYRTPLELGGHGIGLSPHTEPFIPNYGTAGSGIKLKSGMCLALEPIVIDGSNEIEIDKDDNWTIFSPHKNLSVHIEDTIVVTDNVPIILTRETLEGGLI